MRDTFELQVASRLLFYTILLGITKAQENQWRRLIRPTYSKLILTSFKKEVSDVLLFFTEIFAKVFSTGSVSLTLCQFLLCL